MFVSASHVHPGLIFADRPICISLKLSRVWMCHCFICQCERYLSLGINVIFSCMPVSDRRLQGQSSLAVNNIYTDFYSYTGSSSTSSARTLTRSSSASSSATCTRSLRRRRMPRSLLSANFWYNRNYLSSYKVSQLKFSIWSHVGIILDKNVFF